MADKVLATVATVVATVLSSTIASARHLLSLFESLTGQGAEEVCKVWRTSPFNCVGGQMRPVGAADNHFMPFYAICRRLNAYESVPIASATNRICPTELCLGGVFFPLLCPFSTAETVLQESATPSQAQPSQAKPSHMNLDDRTSERSYDSEVPHW